MRTMARVLLLAMIAGGASTIAAQSLRSERLIAPRLNDWKIGYYRTDDQGTIRKEFPPHETIEGWTRMVTTQRLPGLAAHTAPVAFVQTIASGAAKMCPDGRTSPIRRLTLSGHPAARVRFDCPNSPEADGRAETSVVLAVAGVNDMHVKQVTFRGGTASADLAWAERFLSGMAFCAEDDKAPACMR